MFMVYNEMLRAFAPCGSCEVCKGNGAAGVECDAVGRVAWGPSQGQSVGGKFTVKIMPISWLLLLLLLLPMLLFVLMFIIVLLSMLLFLHLSLLLSLLLMYFLLFLLFFMPPCSDLCSGSGMGFGLGSGSYPCFFTHQ